MIFPEFNRMRSIRFRLVQLFRRAKAGGMTAREVRVNCLSATRKREEYDKMTDQQRGFFEQAFFSAGMEVYGAKDWKGASNG